MTRQFVFADVFVKRHFQWGLRGDPLLWNELKETLGDKELPETAEEFLQILHEKYFELTKTKPDSKKHHFYIEKYDTGGMSRGMISPKFWRETGFSKLLENYEEIKCQ